MDQEKVGLLIARERKNKCLTQAQFAIILGVNEKTIGNWEHARSMPDISMLKSISKELDITIDELINGERNKEKIIKDNKIELKDLGIIIKRKRIEKNLTQLQLGEMVNVTRVAIASIENGKILPSINLLLVLCKILDINLNSVY